MRSPERTYTARVSVVCIAGLEVSQHGLVTVYCSPVGCELGEAVTKLHAAPMTKRKTLSAFCLGICVNSPKLK